MARIASNCHPDDSRNFVQFRAISGSPRAPKLTIRAIFAGTCGCRHGIRFFRFDWLLRLVVVAIARIRRYQPQRFAQFLLDLVAYILMFFQEDTGILASLPKPLAFIGEPRPRFFQNIFVTPRSSKSPSRDTPSP